MKSLKLLGVLAAGAFAAATAYGAFVGETNVDLEFDDDGHEHGRHSISGNKSEFALTNDDRSVRAKWRGDIKLTDDGNSIASVDKTMYIEIEEDGVTEKLELSPDDGELQITLWRDGVEAANNEETRAAIDKFILQFLRSSGIKAEERVNAIAKSGGAQAVIDEISLMESNSAARRYIRALVENESLEAEELDALVGAIAEIEGDHDLRHTISAVVENQNLSSQNAVSLLSLARDIESDHDARKLIEVFAETKMDPEVLDLAITLLAQIDSDHDLRKSVEALLENESLSSNQRAELITAAARQIDSDHDLYRILDETAGSISEARVAAAWLDAIDRISSDHDKRKSISSAAEAGPLPDNVWIALIEKTGEISSDHDQRGALEAIAYQLPNREALREAYREAAAAISSDNDRKEALAALK